MSLGFKKQDSVSQQEKYYLWVIDQYVEETGVREIDMNEVMEWSLRKDLCDLPIANQKKALRVKLSKAAAKKYLTDDDGEPVRALHPYTVKTEKKQKVFWKSLLDLTPEQMKNSSQLKRRGVRSTVLQCDRDIRYYNKHVNPGDPIQLHWNFEEDIVENRQSSEYIDAPPE